MKTILCLFLTFSFINQSEAQNKFKGSVYGGLVFSQVDGDQNAGYNKAGYSYGLKIAREVNSKWGYITGIGYIQKGSHSKVDKDNPNKLIFLYRYHYIQLPLYISFKFKKIQTEFGTSLCYFIKGKVNLGGSDQEIRGIRKTDFPLHLGAVVELNSHWRAGAAVEYSIISLVPNTNSYPIYYIRRGVYHNLFNLNLYYQFN